MNFSPRSLLFVPMGAARLLEGAHRRGADAVILDLEDAVPPSGKEAARAALPAAVRALRLRGVQVHVRVNAEGPWREPDLVAAVAAGAQGVFVPKVEAAGELVRCGQILAAAERAQGHTAGRVGLVAMVETPAGVLEARQIAASARTDGLAGRLWALCFGAEDYAWAMGIEPQAEALATPAHWMAMAAHAEGLQCLGLPGSVARVHDLAGFEADLRRARAIGFTGTPCIHPAQIEAVHRVFSVTDEQRARARRVVACYEDALARGEGAVLLEGRMVDVPVYRRALELLQRHPARSDLIPFAETSHD